MNLKEMFENKRIKILTERMKEQQSEIDELMYNLVSKESQINQLYIQNKKYEFELNKYKNSDGTISQLEKDIEKKNTQLKESQNLSNKILDLEAELNRKNAEIEYYKKYTEELQCLPAYKKLLDNISAMKIPDVQNLVDNIIKLNSNSNIMEKFDLLNEKIDSIASRVGYLAHRGCL